MMDASQLAFSRVRAKRLPGLRKACSQLVAQCSVLAEVAIDGERCAKAAPYL
jgi:hypothetical protein